jgi:ABC-2 type transport system permease protein
MLSANVIRAVFRREMKGYFDTPVAYVFLVVFLLLASLLTFFLSNWYELEKASLEPFFAWHPWLYLFLVPAISMRLWAEERRLGTLELLLTLPVRTWELIIAKALSAWCFLLIALALSFPYWITVNLLGDPDNGLIISGYLASALLGAALVSLGSALSSGTHNQVIAFVLTITVSFLFLASGFNLVTGFFSGWLPQWAVDVLGAFSFLNHFDSIARGLLSMHSVLFFLSFIAMWLMITYVNLVYWRR